MSFSDAQVQQVWEKGTIVPNYDSKEWRKDVCKAWIARNRYGKTDTTYGWTIDHINPNGGDSIQNLQPLQWQNNIAKSNNQRWNCAVTSNENTNVETGQ